MGGNRPDGLKLYNFVDNHDVERIYTKLTNKAHFAPVHVLLYTLPGVPSIYYGSEFGIEGRKEKFSDASLRPALNFEDYKDAVETNSCTALIAALGHARQQSKALSYGDYKELVLTNKQYAFSRSYNGECAVVTVNNDDSDYVMTLPAGNASEYVGALSGQHVSVNNGTICVNVKANSGDIWLPANGNVDVSPIKVTPITNEDPAIETPVATEAPTVEAPVADETPAVEVPATEPAVDEAPATEEPATEPDSEETPVSQSPADEPAVSPANAAYDEAFEKGKIAGLQAAVIARMEKNGPVTDQMRRDVENNVYYDSLINWIKSF